MTTKDNALTPMMRQFFSLKAKHPDALMLFRCGDFYETYCDDAVEAARILGMQGAAKEQGSAENNDYLIVAISSEGTVRNGSGDTIKMELSDILKGRSEERR